LDSTGRLLTSTLSLATNTPVESTMDKKAKLLTAIRTHWRIHFAEIVLEINAQILNIRNV
jgi:hypothetical protein